jgi:hypothetical protein
MDKELVVSYYNEDITWLKEIKDYKVTLYNKSNNNVDNSIKIPNVGREIETYFKHIVNNYDNLNEWTFFSQAKPFDHVSNYKSLLNDFPSSLDYSNININNQCFFFYNGHFNQKTLSCYSDGSPHHEPPILDVDGLWKNIFSDNPPDMYTFSPGCIFTISKKQIKIRDIEFYKKCMKLSVSREHGPWEFERIMSYVFNLNYK